MRFVQAACPLVDIGFSLHNVMYRINLRNLRSENTELCIHLDFVRYDTKTIYIVGPLTTPPPNCPPPSPSSILSFSDSVRYGTVQELGRVSFKPKLEIQPTRPFDCQTA